MTYTILIPSILSIVNIIVLGVTSIVFGKMYIKTRASFPLWMTVVAVMLIIHNAIGAIAYLYIDTLFSPGLFPYILGFVVVETIGLLVFLKLVLDQ